jgi:hypothetical protein
LDLNDYAQEVHQANKNWWIDLETGQRKQRNVGEMLMLCVSEVAESMEGARKGLMDDKLPHREMREVEMADTLIRLLDLAGGLGLNLNCNDWGFLHGESLSEMQRNIYAVSYIKNEAESLFTITQDICRAYIPLRSHDHYTGALAVRSAIRAILHHCREFDLDLEGAYHEKMEYNRNRLDHKIEHRKTEGGKKF